MTRDQNLLFGVFAVQLGKVTPEQLVDVAAAWAADTSRDIASRLVALNLITEEDRQFLQRIVDEAVAAHDGDTMETLTAFGGMAQIARTYRGSIVLTADGQVSVPPTVKTPTGMEVDADEEEGVGNVRGVYETPGRYRNSREHARGGMGRVLLVHDDYLGRNIALKELLPHLAGSSRTTADAHGMPPSPARFSANIISRFLQEARITGQLEHPSIVPVYELGHRQDGSLYYTMKLVRGRSLSKAIRECHNLEERLRLLPNFVDLCQAIAYAHSRQIIHRDIKPANVMVGEFGETVVLDWGLAKKQDREDIHEQGLSETIQAMNLGDESDVARTAYGQILGTPVYMAPEQARGEVDGIDSMSDVYALGVVLYEILTGTVPVEGKSTREILNRVIAGELTPIDTGETGAPPELVAIAMKAMQREKSDRYTGAKALADEIERFQSGALVQSYTYGLGGQVLWLLKRHKAKVIPAAIAAMFIVASAAYSYVNVAHQRDIAVNSQMQEAAAREESERRGYQTSILLAGEQLSKHQFVAANQTLWAAPAALRNWEWGHLLREANKDLLTFAGHSAAILSASFDPVGPRAVSGDDGGVIVLWDTDTGETIQQQFSRNETPVSTTSFSLDGTAILFNAYATGVTLYDRDLDSTVYSLGNELERPASRAQYDRTGRLVALGRVDSHAIEIYDLSTQSVVLKLKGHTSHVYDLEFSPAGDQLVSLSDDGTARLWDTGSGSEIVREHAGAGRISDVLFSEDGELLLGGVSAGVQIWDSTDFRESGFLEHESRVVSLVSANDGGTLYTGCADGSIHRWDLPSKTREHMFFAHGDSVESLALNRPETMLLSVSSDQTAKLWPSPVTDRESALARRAFSVSVSPDGAYTALTTRDGGLRVYSGDADALVCSISALRARESIWLGGGSRLLVLSYMSPPLLLDTADWSVVRIMREHSLHPFRASAGGADGRLLATASAPFFIRKSGTYFNGKNHGLPIYLWDSQTGEPKGQVDLGGEAIADLAITRGGTILAGMAGGAIKELESASGKELRSLTGPLPELRCVAINRQETLLAAGARDGRVAFVGLAGFEGTLATGTHDGPVTDLAFSEDGTRLATSSEDGAIIIWDTVSGTPVYRRGTGAATALGVAWNPESGTLLGVGSAMLHRWRSDPWNLQQLPDVPGAPMEERYRQYKRHVRGSVDGSRREDSVIASYKAYISPRTLTELLERFRILGALAVPEAWAGEGVRLDIEISGEEQLQQLRILDLELGDVLQRLEGRSAPENVPVPGGGSGPEILQRLTLVLERGGKEVPLQIEVVKPEQGTNEVYLPIVGALPMLVKGLDVLDLARGYFIGAARGDTLFSLPLPDGQELDGWFVSPFTTDAAHEERILIALTRALNKTLGVQTYDRIMSMNGRPLKRVDVVIEVLREALETCQAGTPYTFKLQVVRGLFEEVEIAIHLV